MLLSDEVWPNDELVEMIIEAGRRHSGRELEPKRLLDVMSASGYTQHRTTRDPQPCLHKPTSPGASSFRQLAGLDPVRKRKLKEHVSVQPFVSRSKEAPLSAAERAYTAREITNRSLYESFLAVAEDSLVTNDGLQRWAILCFVDGWLTEADVRTAFLQVLVCAARNCKHLQNSGPFQWCTLTNAVVGAIGSRQIQREK